MSNNPVVRKSVNFKVDNLNHQTSPRLSNNSKTLEPFSDSSSVSSKSLLHNLSCSRRNTVLNFSTNTATEDLLITPFAQILSSLRQIRTNIQLIDDSYTKIETQTMVSSDLKEEKTDGYTGTKMCQKISNFFVDMFQPKSTTDSINEMIKLTIVKRYKEMCSESLAEVDWCLSQLEALDATKSVSNMASAKFIKLMNRELRLNTKSADTGQIHRFIKNTFMERTHNSMLGRTTPMHDHSPMATISSRRTDSSGMHPFGIQISGSEELAELIDSSLDVWGMDIFLADVLSDYRPLTTITYSIFKQRLFMETYDIDPHVLVQFLIKVEDSYLKSNPYHNNIHAADVAQTAHAILCMSKFENKFTTAEQMALIFACAIHDVDHPGVTNMYLVNTENKLALLYNDISVLENHHLAVAFNLLSKGTDIFINIPRNERKALRKLIIDLVLATDMSRHMKVVADLKTVVESNRVVKQDFSVKMQIYNERVEILKTIIHLCDLSNPTKAWPIYTIWVERISQEFFLQGDKEKASGLDVSPMCDRLTASIEKSQVSFIDFIVHPLYETWGELVYPDMQQILTTLVENRDKYADLAAMKPEAPSSIEDSELNLSPILSTSNDDDID